MKSALLKAVITVILVLAIAGLGWKWIFERFYVPSGSMAVIIAKVGEDLPPGQILAREGQKGIQETVLGEGRHFLNPVLYEREILPMILIPPGKVGVVTSKVGEELPEGEFLAEPGQKGIWRKVLGPGRYRLNPYGYTVNIVDAISIPIGYCGVITSLSGEQAEEGQFAGYSQKGIRKDILQPGLYYVNPREYKVDVLEIGVNQVSLIGGLGGEVITKGQMVSQNVAMDELQSRVLTEQKRKRFDYLQKSADLFAASRSTWRQAPAAQQQAVRGRAPVRTPEQQEEMDMARVRESYIQGDSMATMGLNQYVEFPSRDGFQISLDMTVEFELLPENIAWIFQRYGDLPAVVDKILMPQITSVSRNKGSEYGARDFIVGEGREKFQDELTQTLNRTLGEKNIVVHNALIRHVEVPMQILEPIQQASIAVEQDLTNKERQNTAKRLAELNTEMTLIEQRREQVAEETRKIRAEIDADQEKQVARIAAEAVRDVAEIEKGTRLIEADTVRLVSKAEAEAIRMVEGERASGLQMKARAFGQPAAFSLWAFATGLNPSVSINILHAGEGTLWTDLEKATLGEMGGAQVIRGGQK
jgi:hypothetical protein